jgi:arsenite methyltransferase
MKRNFQPIDFSIDQLANFYDELPLWSAPFGLNLLDVIDYSSPVVALDIGCGNGFPLLELAQRFGRNSFFYGIDPWLEGIEHLNRKMQFYNIENVSVSIAIAEKLPFENEKFDLITSNNGLNNVSSLEKSLLECHRTLKKDGRLVFTANLPGTFSLFYDALIQALSDKGLASIIPNIDNHIKLKRKSVEEICSALENSRFRLLTKQEESFSLHFSSGTAFLDHFLIRLHFLGSWLLLMPPNLRLKIMSLVEDRLNVSSEKNKGLRMDVPFAVYKAEKY